MTADPSIARLGTPNSSLSAGLAREFLSGEFTGSERAQVANKRRARAPFEFPPGESARPTDIVVVVVATAHHRDRFPCEAGLTPGHVAS
jgi:hypothetical protein